MPVTFIGPDRPQPLERGSNGELNFSAENFERYGRLNLNQKQIADMERCSTWSINRAFMDNELRKAYNRGRAETVVAIRQKQVAVALAGDTAMLRHVGQYFADQNDDVERGVPEHFSPEQHTWDGKLHERLKVLRAHFSEDVAEVEAGA